MVFSVAGIKSATLLDTGLLHVAVQHIVAYAADLYTDNFE